MTPHDTRRLDLLCELYLQALEQGHLEVQEQLWQIAREDEAIVEAFREIHEGLLEEIQLANQEGTDHAIRQTVEQHLPSATPLRAPGSLPVSAVAQAMKKFPAANKPAVAALMEKLIHSTDTLPDLQGFTRLRTWAEAQYGPAPESFWQAFHRARLDLEMAHPATAYYSMAARPAPPQEG
ncbi:MAG TPA: hypothetical protein PKD72_03785 [Gemmatales bacterium]|nr:hypothetical protein [Gemmatales bacterium]